MEVGLLVISGVSLASAVAALLVSLWARRDVGLALQRMLEEKARADLQEDRVARGVALIARSHRRDEGDDGRCRSDYH
jgi:hypothetical protein